MEPHSSGRDRMHRFRLVVSWLRAGHRSSRGLTLPADVSWTMLRHQTRYRSLARHVITAVEMATALSWTLCVSVSASLPKTAAPSGSPSCIKCTKRAVQAAPGTAPSFDISSISKTRTSSVMSACAATATSCSNNRRCPIPGWNNQSGTAYLGGGGTAKPKFSA
jgi:hypothetical protein